MPGPFEYTVWSLCTLLEAAVVACALAKHSFRRYFLLNIYMASSCLVNLGRYHILSRYG